MTMRSEEISRKQIFDLQPDPDRIIAEVLGVVASGTVVAQTTDRVVSLLNPDVVQVRHAKEEIMNISTEVRDLGEVLKAVNRLAEGSLYKLDQEIKQCESTLEKIQSRLDRNSTFKTRKLVSTIRSRLVWPFKSEDVREIISQLERRKSNLSLYLSADAADDRGSSTQHVHSVVRFSSVPPPESLVSCKNHNCNRTSVQNLSDCARAGCHTCHLRHLGIVSIVSMIREEFGSSQSPILSISTLQHPFINIFKQWLERDGVRVDGRLNVFLYTRAGQAKTSWPIVGVGREVNSRRLSYANIVADWLRLCREDHPACPSNMDVELPTRLLDVGSFESDSIRLKTTAGQRGLYTALSHCWGGGIEMRTTSNSIAARQKQILYSDLPKTFQDAVTVTRDLGLRYLWIDALCIIQDNIHDWEWESGNMAAVYQNAYTVLGADMSRDSHNGFLQAISGNYYFDQGVPIAAVDSENSLIYARKTTLHDNPCSIFTRREPLSTRAWTLQEQMLASRMIHFATSEMIWECNSALLCECMELDGRSPSVAIYQKPMLVTSPWSVNNFKTWYKIVRTVASRDITKPSDILPCLSGLARRFQDAGAGVYLAGLWLDDLLLGLLWEGSKYCSRATPYRAPSWSWASVCVDNNYRNNHFTIAGFLDKDTKLTKIYASIVEASCTQKGKDPLGSVSDGYVKIVAPLLEMTPGEYYEPGYSRLTPLGVKPGSRELPAWFDFKFIPSLDENLFCLFVGELSCGSDGVPCRGLVLRKRRDVSGIYERVGGFRLSRGEEVDFIQGVEDSVVVII